ncbi:MAG: OmpA family protein [Longimicrobiales bacterium]
MVDTTLFVEFDFDSAVAPDTALERVAAAVRANFSAPRYSFSIVGYADVAGDPAYNVDLSRRRAELIERTLIERAGIPPLRIHATGAGSTDRFLSEHRLARENRRTVILVHSVPYPTGSEPTVGAERIR